MGQPFSTHFWHLGWKVKPHSSLTFSIYLLSGTSNDNSNRAGGSSNIGDHDGDDLSPLTVLKKFDTLQSGSIISMHCLNHTRQLVSFSKNAILCIYSFGKT